MQGKLKKAVDRDGVKGRGKAWTIVAHARVPGEVQQATAGRLISGSSLMVGIVSRVVSLVVERPTRGSAR
jgi:hypothetical protein